LPFFRQALSGVDAQVLLEYASRLWRYLESHLAWGAQTGFEALLLIKRASLGGCSVPTRFSHVIIDESQDVPGSLLQIIERGRQVLITLGDEYQKARCRGAA
jgi:superfamily I DNA and RNA helicase